MGNSRDRQLAQQRADRLAARQAADDARRRRRTAVLAGAVALVLVVGAAIVAAVVLREPEAPAAAAAGTVDCEYETTPDAAARDVEPPPGDDVDATTVYEVTLATNRGDVVFEMDSAEAPCTAHSLRSLAEASYFDGTPCHRLTTGGLQVLQCGDPGGTGAGGPGYQFADENLEGATYPRGTVAMANAGPGTNGSQFFLVYGDSQLSPAYTPFGRVTAGLEVLDAVAEAGTDDANGAGDGKPKVPVTIETVRAEASAD